MNFFNLHVNFFNLHNKRLHMKTRILNDDINLQEIQVLVPYLSSYSPTILIVVPFLASKFFVTTLNYDLSVGASLRDVTSDLHDRLRRCF